MWCVGKLCDVICVGVIVVWVTICVLVGCARDVCALCCVLWCVDDMFDV